MGNRSSSCFSFCSPLFLHPPAFLDIRKLQPETGICTFDPGFTSTASCASSITHTDGEKGVLLYRGYAIEELAVGADMADVSFLLLNGELPTAAQRVAHVGALSHHALVHEKLIQFFHGFKHDAHPMVRSPPIRGPLAPPPGAPLLSLCLARSTSLARREFAAGSEPPPYGKGRQGKRSPRLQRCPGRRSRAVAPT